MWGGWRRLPATRSGRVYLALIALLGALPWLAEAAGQGFLLDLASRGLIFAIAALSLNLILGYGGMISLGHVAYLGVGAYCVGIPMYHGLDNGWLHLALAVAICALLALITGAVSLRTKGAYFIMITLAFSQMVYFVFLSLEQYGADDGLVIDDRSRFPSWLSMADDVGLYYWIYGLLVVTLALLHRLVGSRFGRVIVGAKHNEPRMQALGFNTYVYRLIAYVIAAVICGLAGVLLGNFTLFISPEMIGWMRSAELIFMVIIGGAATLFGPLVGALLFLILAEALSLLTVYWHVIFGVMLIALVLWSKTGVHGWLARLDGGRRAAGDD